MLQKYGILQDNCFDTETMIKNERKEWNRYIHRFQFNVSIHVSKVCICSETKIWSECLKSLFRSACRAIRLNSSNGFAFFFAVQTKCGILLVDWTSLDPMNVLIKSNGIYTFYALFEKFVRRYEFRWCNAIKQSLLKTIVSTYFFCFSKHCVTNYCTFLIANTVSSSYNWKNSIHESNLNIVFSVCLSSIHAIGYFERYTCTQGWFSIRKRTMHSHSKTNIHDDLWFIWQTYTEGRVQFQ